MDKTTWIIAIILILGFFFAVFSYIISKKKKTHPDYYALYVMGLIWLIVGIPFRNWGLSIIGFLFMLDGVANRSKWKENKKYWKGLNKKSDEVKLITRLAIVLFVVITVLIIYLGMLFRFPY